MEMSKFLRLQSDLKYLVNKLNRLLAWDSDDLAEIAELDRKINKIRNILKNS